MPSEQPYDDNVVTVENLTRYFGTTAALESVSFKVKRGETFAILGPNGSGKSTLLRTLCGYLQASSGRVAIDGYDLFVAPRDAKSKIGYLPDESTLYRHMQVREFLHFMARLKRVKQADADDAVAATANKLSLGSVLNSRIGTLSRGYRQRVGIAQAIINNPAVILLDEPTNGLDPVQIREWRNLMRMLAVECTVIFTSHVLNEVSSLADRVALLVDGRLKSIETMAKTTDRCLIEIDASNVATLESLRVQRITDVRKLDNSEHVLVTLQLGAAESIADLIERIMLAGIAIYLAKPVEFDLESAFFSKLAAPS